MNEKTSDAHCHLFDLFKLFPEAETERRNLGVLCAGSAWNLEDFLYQEKLKHQALQDGGPRILCCFGVHPQMPALKRDQQVSEATALLESLAEQRRLDGVGETGFDLFDQQFRATETIQERLFARHLSIALSYDLPLILHVRKALPKIFAQGKILKRLRAVIFHAYPGGLSEGEALLRRGINVYFSFGNAVILGRKESQRAGAGLPGDRILTETDAPYQKLRGTGFSCWRDLGPLRESLTRLRVSGGNSLPSLDANFRRAYGI
ncbi:MAG: TatD family hydrolase [Spirochaetaceae bacterium]|jgi:TatD DNase family protein|nr:TatD family hydrolase [Spirochaetaceae bacterium]